MKEVELDKILMIEEMQGESTKILFTAYSIFKYI